MLTPINTREDWPQSPGKFLALGLGESALLHYQVLRTVELLGHKGADDSFGATVIGVNDVSRLVKPDYLLVVNPKSDFPAERWAWIEKNDCLACLTQYADSPVWNAKQFKQGIQGCRLEDSGRVCHSTNSPYMAVVIAYLMGATQIGLLGVDFTENWFFQKGKHPLADKFAQIDHDYNQLWKALNEKGVGFWNLSPESRLSIPRMSTKDFNYLK